MKVSVVTSFSARGEHLYGRRFLDSFLKHWPQEVELHIAHEGPRVIQPDDLWFTWRDLDTDPDRAAFLLRNQRDPTRRGNRTDYRTQVERFCHKVFALTDQIPETDWWVWIDADVETVKPVTMEYLERILPQGKVLSYLKRERSPIEALRYTECGFVGGYRVTDRRVRTLLERMRWCYSSDQVLSFPPIERHDSCVFDWSRRLSNIPDQEQHDLARDTRNLQHPWPESPLGETMVHAKGPQRKAARYGSAS